MSSRSLNLAVIAGLLLAACSSSALVPQPQIIIASDLPSESASAVPAMQDAIRLAVNENSNLPGYHLAYVSYDDSLGGAPWPEKGMQNLKSMFANAQVLGMVGPFNSHITIEEIPRASVQNLVMLSPAATNACFTVDPLCDAQMQSAHVNYPINFFRIAPPDPVQGRAMAHFAGQLHITRVAAINMWHPPLFTSGDPYIAEFGRELPFQGGKVVLTEESPYRNHAFTDFLTRAKLAGADAIYAVGDGDGGICDIRAQMGSDFKYLLLTDGATEDDRCSKAPASVTTFGTEDFVDPTSSPDAAVKSFVDKFKAAYPHVHINDIALNAYDCALILITAIRRAIDKKNGGEPTRLEVLTQVATGEFDGGLTGNYKFLPSGDAVSPTMSIWGVKDNKWYYIDRLDASASS